MYTILDQAILAYILLVNVRKKNALLSVLGQVEWILPVLSLDKTENNYAQYYYLTNGVVKGRHHSRHIIEMNLHALHILLISTNIEQFSDFIAEG